MAGPNGEPNFAADGQALLTGGLMASAMKMADLFKTCRVTPSIDTDGDYEPHFFVTLDSGRYMVMVTKVDDP